MRLPGPFLASEIRRALDLWFKGMIETPSFIGIPLYASIFDSIKRAGFYTEADVRALAQLSRINDRYGTPHCCTFNHCDAYPIDAYSPTQDFDPNTYHGVE